MGEVVIWTDQNGQAHPSITIDGWMKIINAHPAFTGIQFNQDCQNIAPGNDAGKHIHACPQSMTCTIYRSDRQLPITVSEHLDEVKNDHPAWHSMPRRMLRHRVLQQCARLAFGISAPEFVPQESVSGIDCQYLYGSTQTTQPGKKNHPNANNTNSPTHSAPAKKLSRTEQLKTRLNESPNSGNCNKSQY
jgi:hypothetical protein